MKKAQPTSIDTGGRGRKLAEVWKKTCKDQPKTQGIKMNGGQNAKICQETKEQNTSWKQIQSQVMPRLFVWVPVVYVHKCSTRVYVYASMYLWIHGWINGWILWVLYATVQSYDFWLPAEAWIIRTVRRKEVWSKSSKGIVRGKPHFAL